MPIYRVIVTEELEHDLFVDAPDEETARDLAENAVIEDGSTYFMACTSRDASVVGEAEDGAGIEPDVTYEPDTEET